MALALAESGAVLDILHIIIRNYIFDNCLILYCIYLKFTIFDLYILVKFHLASTFYQLIFYINRLETNVNYILIYLISYSNIFILVNLI